MRTLRRTLFTVHMWIGLTLGLLLAVLGLSGSLLVYDQAIADFLIPPPHAQTAGPPLSLTMLADAAREAAAERGLEGGQMQMILPQKTSDALVVRLGGISPMGNMPGMRRESRSGLQIFIDPVSGEVLGTRNAVLPPLLTFAHQLHGNFLMGRSGRPLIGWLGVAMCLLGLTGLVLWWPKRGQWKYAFKVRSEATGLRFHRELHAATGIWMFFVFMAVSYSGLVLAWPQAMGVNPPGRPPAIVANDGKRLGATEAVIAATAAVPGLQARSITFPASPDQPISVNYLSNGAIAATVLIDPYRGKILAVRDASQSFLAWMRPVHQGSLNVVWRFLVFLSGLAPALFVTTGLLMWWKKRQRHVPMTMMTDDVTAEEA
ncbi:MAG TPA: PepSY-associated TM helix domain-containing protein [Rhizomicrobium sp.]|nr:PepSY-associated TM helix domain-containing protein [Rhizomicrobium sp.]